MKKAKGASVKKAKSSFKEWRRTHRKGLLTTYYSVAGIVLSINAVIILDNTITRTETIEKDEPIHFTTEYEDDNSLELWTEEVKQVGIDGLQKVYTEEKKKLITGVVRESDVVNTETIEEPVKEIIRRGTRRWQYMICSDGHYWSYSDEQFKDPHVGFTHSSDDSCAKNNQGKMIALTDTPPPAGSYSYPSSSGGGGLSEDYVRAMEIIAERERELRNSDSGSTNHYETPTIEQPANNNEAAEKAAQQARVAADNACKARANSAGQSLRSQLGALGGQPNIGTEVANLINSTYQSCMRSYGY